MGSFKENLENQRQRFIEIFNDTIKSCEKEEELKDSIHNTINNTFIYHYDPTLIQTSKTGINLNNISVTKNRTFEAAMNLHKSYPLLKIAVLNFASATNPGGGVLKGSSAQEECLCRASTLYPCLIEDKPLKEYYVRNRSARNPLHDDTIVYTPGITVFKTDDKDYSLLNQKNWTKVDVITCAAPNLRENPNNSFNHEGSDAVSISDQELYAIHLQRALHILQRAYENKVQILVLGAFGCGAFRNDPKIVAEAYYDALNKFGDNFVKVEFAVYCSPKDTTNYEVFKKRFNERKE